MPVPGTAGSLVNSVSPGMNPLGSVGVQVRPPSKLALTAQPSLKFQSFAPVTQLSGFSGFTASGVSFCAVVSWLTSTTSCTCGVVLLTLARLGAPGAAGGVGGSLHATRTSAVTERATRTLLGMSRSGWGRRRICPRRPTPASLKDYVTGCNKIQNNLKLRGLSLRVKPTGIRNNDVSKLAPSTRVTSKVRTACSPAATRPLSPRSTSNERDVITILSGVPENRAARAAAERGTKSSLRFASAVSTVASSSSKGLGGRRRSGLNQKSVITT